jgi:hypothetical protein
VSQAAYNRGLAGGSAADARTPGGGLLSRFAALPRAFQWAIYGLFAMAAYFGVVEPVLDRTGEMGGRASALEASLRTYAASKGKLDAAVTTTRTGERQFGELALPADLSKRSTEFSSALDEIMRRHNIANVTSGSRNTALEKGPLVDYYRAGNQQRVEKLVKDLTFMATPEQFAAALADMEREPLVTTISRVNVRQTDGQDRFNRMLRVNIAAESWVVVKK